MRRKWVKVIAVLWAICIAITGSASEAKGTTQKKILTFNELIEHAKDYDGTQICVEGEAIGEILYRGEYVWVNVSDGNNSAIGVFMSKEMAKSIQRLGHYGTQGDELQVTGVFHRACARHGGDLDIHVQSLEILERGSTNAPEVPGWLKCLTSVSAAVCVALGALAFCRVLCYNRQN